MIRNILEHIGGVAAYPVIALVLFVAVFAGYAIWAMTMSRQQVDHYSRLPLEDDALSRKGEPRHES
ncbi:MAG TPA: cbb3-type cytochrome c oxidase subunit 3 [Kiritimatiellia bacterium]|nr:cbb3-type cytochrome c oxidase subunit 3 [Kiritimatiellia bacterium]